VRSAGRSTSDEGGAHGTVFSASWGGACPPLGKGLRDRRGLDALGREQHDEVVQEVRGFLGKAFVALAHRREDRLDGLLTHLAGDAGNAGRKELDRVRERIRVPLALLHDGEERLEVDALGRGSILRVSVKHEAVPRWHAGPCGRTS
jgi:hypothetical protein